MSAPTLTEQAAVQRLGQSAYAEPGRLSWPQREHETHAMLDLIAKVAERTGYSAGHEAGRRAGRLEMARYLGPDRLVDAIARDLDVLRRQVDELGIGSASERIES